MPRNQFLAALPENDLKRLEPHLTPVTLEQTTVVGQPGTRIQKVYFPQGTLGSIVVNSSQGDSVEAAVVGVEGVTAFPDVLARGVAVHTAIIQGPGEALSMDSDVFREEFARCGSLHDMAIRYMQYLLVQTSQVAMCNRAHNLDERLAKWLLLCSDGIQSDVLILTQEFMATMLGVQRPGVTQAALALKEAQSITYTRGSVRIINRPLLDSFSCECYGVLREQRNLLLPQPEK